MSIRNRAYLKNRWVNGFIPQYTDFSDLFDSFFNLSDDNIDTPITTISTTASLSLNQRTILVTGNTTLTLPAASASEGKIYIIKKIDSNTTTCHILGHSIDELIEDQTSYDLTTKYQKIILQCDKSNWWII